MPTKEIAEKFGITVNGVWWIVRNAKKAEDVNADEKPEPITADETAEKANDILQQIAKLQKELDAQRNLARAAKDLMLAWKEKYELTQRVGKINGILSQKENAYFDALRDAKGVRNGESE